MEKGAKGDAGSYRIPSAESRSRKPKFKEYKRVHHAQNFAKKLGVVDADYGGRIDNANVCNQGLFLCAARDVPMPRSIKASPVSAAPGEVELANYTPALTGGVGEITINSAASEWRDIGAFARDRREEQDISTGDPRHFIVHELGELVLEQSAGFDKANPLGAEYEAVEDEFQQEEALGRVYDVLGDRATHNHGEFVAETFAALMLGRAEELHQDEEIMKLYGRYGGEGIRKYDENL